MSQNVSAPGTTERACPSRIDESSKEMPARRAYVAVVLVVSVCTAVNWALAAWLAPTNLAMVYLLGVVLIAVRCPPAPSIVCALASILAFDFLFVPPVFTLRFGDTQYLITGLALLLVGSVVGTDKPWRSLPFVRHVPYVRRQLLPQRYGRAHVFVGPSLGLRGPRKVVQALTHHDDHLHLRLRGSG